MYSCGDFYTMQQVLEKILCYHCGDGCYDEANSIGEKYFCCSGCKLVYEILQENNLCAYYDLNNAPGIKLNSPVAKRFNFLDEPDMQQKLIQFKKGSEARIVFQIPSMHCSSCIWLLENLKKINAGIVISEVNFIRKELYVVFDEKKTTLRKIVEQLALTGYEPSLHLATLEKSSKKRTNRSRILKIGVAGFCFGNIMMLSFPEYFSSGKIIDERLKQFFSYMILLLALPVFFYSASEFFQKSLTALKHKTTSIDIPIAIGIAAIFLRSVYEIISGAGTGYFDSGSGLVFFMLIGRWFQDFTFESLSFERDYKSYFPIAVTRIRNGNEKDITVNDLKINDRILIRNNEIIPVDALLIKGTAAIDYHFVTGESIPVSHQPGETVFAGGKQTGSSIELQVTKEISQSYLTQLWNRNFSKHQQSRFEKLVSVISKWFIVVTLLIAFAAAAFWWNTDMQKAINAFTAVLVIACPCALALSAPFTYGNILRILGKNKIYLRNYQSLEKLADVNTIVFDKTGTLTKNNSSQINFTGTAFTGDEEKIIYSLARQSSHPLSKLLCKEISQDGFYPVKNYSEEIGRGIEGEINSIHVRVGSLEFTGLKEHNIDRGTHVFISFNKKYRGYFSLGNSYRQGIKSLAKELIRKNYSLAVLTGDNESEKDNLSDLFLSKAELRFNQSPENKLSFINCLHKKNLNVLMMGDGLNDAGALLKSDVGISITENTNSFTPASDGILDASKLTQLSNLLAYSKSAVKIIIISFILSLLYNLVGLSFAVTGTLSPLIAAILMPISTISLVLFTVAASSIKGKMLNF